VKRSPKTCAVCASAVALVLAACGAPAEQAQPRVAPAPERSVLVVKDAWARAADSGATAAVYFTITNTARIADTLAAVVSTAAEETGLHMSMLQGRTMHMAALRSLPVPADDSVVFAPLGAHVMLTRMTRSLVAGDTVALTLSFVSGQSIEVRAGVRQP
jgi:copper(I)-binding protein